jgi:hypothetical protein
VVAALTYAESWGRLPAPLLAPRRRARLRRLGDPHPARRGLAAAHGGAHVAALRPLHGACADRGEARRNARSGAEREGTPRRGGDDAPACVGFVGGGALRTSRYRATDCVATAMDPRRRGEPRRRAVTCHHAGPFGSLAARRAVEHLRAVSLHAKSERDRDLPGAGRAGLDSPRDRARRGHRRRSPGRSIRFDGIRGRHS